MIRAGIVGGGGYTAGELIRILSLHPDVEIVSVVSNSQAGKPISSVHQDLIGDLSLSFSDTLVGNEEVLFLCMGHGQSMAYLERNILPEYARIIDLSQDFRHLKNRKFKEITFTYGLPETNRSVISRSTHIANPGCFATAIELALLPLAAAGKLSEDIHIHGITGSTGAGQEPTDTSHFSWRNNNISSYKIFTHQHLTEIKETLETFSPPQGEIIFIPIRGNFTRGIYVSAHTRFNGSLEDAYSLFEKYYDNHPFTHVIKGPLHLKQVVNTNKCLLQLELQGSHLLITSIIDNLLKGASGQAVQNMNLMFGLQESAGLSLKASYF
jgi:N-acetyl-gamma-glutamyl-phosphate reductase